MRLTLTEVKQRVSKLVPENIDYEVDVEGGFDCNYHKTTRSLWGAGQSLTVENYKKYQTKGDCKASLLNFGR